MKINFKSKEDLKKFIEDYNSGDPLKDWYSEEDLSKALYFLAELQLKKLEAYDQLRRNNENRHTGDIPVLCMAQEIEQLRKTVAELEEQNYEAWEVGMGDDL